MLYIILKIIFLNYVYGYVSMCGSRYPVPEEGIRSLLNSLQMPVSCLT